MIIELQQQEYSLELNVSTLRSSSAISYLLADEDLRVKTLKNIPVDVAQ